MGKDLINAIVYTDIHDELGPNPIFWFPSDLSENIRMLVGIKTVTLLSGDQGITPDSLMIIPFPSLRLKGLIRYFDREDPTRRGGFARSAITFLFKEADDIIIYKYMIYLNTPFDEITRKIIELEKKNVDESRIFEEIRLLRVSVCNLLNEFRNKEISPPTAQEFPQLKDEKLVDFKFKLVVIGDPGVGKTSTILRFTDNAFRRTYIPTMGVNITDKNFRVGDYTVEIILWDLAGQTKFETMRKHFYQGSEAILLIFDLTNPITFRNIRNWYEDIKRNTQNGSNLIGYIFGNKSDLIEERKIKESDALKLADELNLNYIETSAKTGKNLENAFYKIAETVIGTKMKGLF
jgi:small GTP-binding protein